MITKLLRKALANIIYGLLIGISYQTMERDRNFVIATDIDNFWSIYDLVKQESDALKQIESLYVQKR